MIITGVITFQDNRGGAATCHHSKYFKKAEKKTGNIQEF
jgi:hypothetical protein